MLNRPVSHADPAGDEPVGGYVTPVPRARAAGREDRTRRAPGMTVRPPADRRFRRAQVRPTRRRGWRRLLAWRTLRTAFVLAAFGSAAYGGATLVAGARVLRIDRIVVRGNERMSTGEVLAVVGGLKGQNILFADLRACRTALMEASWVADASLRRVLPSTIEVSMTERVPMALARVGSRVYLVDSSGVVIDEFGPRHAQFDLPIIDGLVPGSQGRGELGPRHVALASRVMDALGSRPDLARQVSQIDVTDAHDAIVMLKGDPARLHLGDTRFAERLESYVDLAPTLRERVPEIDYVDLRFEERVYVRPGDSVAPPPRPLPHGR